MEKMRSARTLMRSKARSFYLASVFLPASLRSDVEIVYAWYRTVDDLVDEALPDLGRAEILDRLRRWEAGLLSGDLSGEQDPIHRQVLRVAERHGIPRSHLIMVIQGGRTDLDLGHLQTREELRSYAVLVAGSVGMVMAPILGASGDDALRAACDLGVAMQLTNILRDVGEDLDRGRVYLPRDEMTRLGYSPAEFYERRVTPEFRTLMSDIMQEARDLYRHGVEGIPALHPATRFSIRLAATLYSRILNKIEANDFDVFTRRAHLGAAEKWMAAAPVYLRHRQADAGR